MTTPAHVPTDEEAFTACLAGRPVPTGAAHLTAFTDAVRAGATAPGRPNAALAVLLATGLLTDQSEPSTRTAGHPARASRKRPRMLLSTLTARFAAAGTLAKAACAGGVLAVALTGTATTVTLAGSDDSVVRSQDGAVADPVADTTGPTEIPGPTEGADPVAQEDTDVDDPGSGDPGAGDPATEVPTTPAPDDAAAAAAWAEGPEPGQSFGDWVSEGARNGWSTGERVSEAAHQRNADRRTEREAARAAAPAPVQPASVQPASVPPAPAPQPAPEQAAPAPAPSPAPAPAGTGGGGGEAKSNGHGNGHGNGYGNGTK